MIPIGFLDFGIMDFLETLLIAFWGTTLATMIAMPVAYLAARNVTPVYPVTYLLARAAMVAGAYAEAHTLWEHALDREIPSWLLPESLPQVFTPVGEAVPEEKKAKKSGQ